MAIAKQAPMFSRVFYRVEGFNVVSQDYPVFSPSGEYLGYTEIMYAPELWRTGFFTDE